MRSLMKTEEISWVDIRHIFDVITHINFKATWLECSIYCGRRKWHYSTEKMRLNMMPTLSKLASCWLSVFSEWHAMIYLVVAEIGIPITLYAVNPNLTYSPHIGTVIWWCHDIETIFALLDLCEEKPPVTSAFPSRKASNVNFQYFLCW